VTLLKCDHCASLVDAADADKLLGWRHVRVARAAWTFQHADTLIVEYHACTDACLRELLRTWANR
jgi:hypothetical protein